MLETHSKRLLPIARLFYLVAFSRHSIRRDRKAFTTATVANLIFSIIVILTMTVQRHNREGMLSISGYYLIPLPTVVLRSIFSVTRIRDTEQQTPKTITILAKQLDSLFEQQRSHACHQ